LVALVGFGLGNAFGLEPQNFTVQAVKGGTVAVDGPVQSLKVGDSLYSNALSIRGRVTRIEGNLAVVDFTTEQKLKAGDTLTNTPNPELEKKFHAEDLLGAPAVATAVQPSPAPSSSAPVSAPASEVGLADWRDISSLNYFTPGGRVAIATTFTTSLADTATLKQANTEISTASDSPQSLQLDAVFGITDRLNLGLTLGYLLHDSQQITVDSTASTSTYARSGISDPAFRLVYRFPYSARVAGDFAFSVSPKIVTAKAASASESGNGGKGDTSITVGTDILAGSKETELRIGSSVELDSSGSNDAASGASPYTFDFSGSATFGTQLRIHSNESFYVDAAAALLVPFAQFAHYSSGTYTTESITGDASPILNVTFGLKFAEHGLIFWKTIFQSQTTDHQLTTRSSGTVATVSATETALAMAFGLQFEL
jgi:hypothetical protein